MIAFLRQHKLAVLILGLYLALGALYGVTSPLFEPSDEHRTSAWQVGEILNDTHRLTLPADLKPGTYRIIVGLYDPQTGQRLPLLDAAGKEVGNEVVVATVQVGP